MLEVCGYLGNFCKHAYNRCSQKAMIKENIKRKTKSWATMPKNNFTLLHSYSEYHFFDILFPGAYLARWLANVSAVWLGNLA